MSLNAPQQAAMKKIVEGKNLYISGPGGVGKSYLINHIMDKFSDSTVLLAPTGIAALNINGATIHSAFKFPLGILTKAHHNRVHDKVHELFDKNGPVRRIIIDEISMVRGDVLNAIDINLRKARRLNIPFGGLQVIVVGDFFQLPPVVTGREKSSYFELYDSEFAFGGTTWSSGGFDHVELNEIMRQDDEVFIGHLQSIRQKTDGYLDSVRFFNRHARQNNLGDLDDPVFLCTTNRNADMINEERYESLGYTEEKVYRGKITGTFESVPSPKELKLRVGTKVIFTANTEDFKNGETGYVAGFLGDKIEVIKERDETTVFVEKYKWEQLDYTTADGSLKSYPIGTYQQYPLKHGWAVTIHKSQGMTLDSAVIDLGRGCFASGQLYVALSRLRSLDGLSLVSDIHPGDVIVDSQIQAFYDNDCRGISLF